MKKYTLLFIVLAGLTSTLLAQDGPKHEIGIRLLDLRDFNLIYKYNTSDNTYLRLRSSSGRFNVGNDISGYGIGSYAGVEIRKAIAGKSEFIYGGELGMFYSRNGVVNGEVTSTFNVLLGGVVGIQHQLSDYFNLGLEIVPSLGINTGRNTNTTYSFNASFSSAAIFVTYKFGKTSS